MTSQAKRSTLDDLPREDPAAVAAHLERALAASGEDPDRLVATDRAVIGQLAAGLAGDEVLAHLDLDSLAAVADRCLRRLEVGAEASGELQHDAWQLLGIVRRRPIMLRIGGGSSAAGWPERILALVVASHFTFGRLLEQRCEEYGGRTLFRLGGERPQNISWRQMAGRVDLIARGLHAVCATTLAAPMAILSENRLEMALADLACLASGVVNVVIPATSSDADVTFILRHSGAAAVIVSSTEQLRKVLKARDELPQLHTIIAFDRDAARRRGVLPFEAVLQRASEVSREQLAEFRAAVKIDDLATVMYTSGTTGTPKGIMFSHRNIVFKRFARALALPEIGEDDRFLCYLPLFHTFGRFLEMCGCVFWGATYCFADGPNIETISRQMQALEPTVFISIPMKWMQLHELIRRKVDIETASDEAILAATREVTGGALRWGLSAAGYLDPEVFRFFQRQGIELMSGFGMTEATGGITMTPPGRYRDDSLGCALPGIELALASDGELKVRGPYVMKGYLNLPEGERSFDGEGWFCTGDLMEADGDGFLRIVDRKKEIYKNVKGQTIAPQKIENLFRDFESVGRIFLVGDHRSFNTALIYPDPSYTAVDLASLSEDERRDHFRSLVVSANAFLAPFERIVDFALIDRDFDAATGELTAKGTFRRKNIERNFASTISLLYRRTSIVIGGLEVVFPNWLFQALGITTQDLRVDGDRLGLVSTGTWLTIQLTESRVARIGSAVYRLEEDRIDIGRMLTSPRLWIGNAEMVTFAPLEEEQRWRRQPLKGVTWLRPIAWIEPEAADRAAVEGLLRRREYGLPELHRITQLLQTSSARDAVLAVRSLEDALATSEGELRETVLQVLRRAAGSPCPEAVRRAFQVLLPAEQPQRLEGTLAAFLASPHEVLGGDTIAALVERDLSDECLQALLTETERRATAPWPLNRAEIDSAASLLDLLASYGAVHPTRYRRLRAVLTRIAMAEPVQEIGAGLAAARGRLEEGFRSWVGPPSRIAVDPETGREYRWDDVVETADDVDEEARQVLLDAFRNTSMLREGVFLFSGSLIRLEDILPSGIWIRLLGEEHGKSVYRVAVRTRHRHQFDLAVNLNRGMSADEVGREIDWLILCSEPADRPPLVETFGGYWPQYDLWTEEFIAGETLDHALQRLSRHERERERLWLLWPFAAWSAMSAFVDLWDRTGEANPSPGNVAVPLHDYHRGSRLVSISGRRRFAAVTDLLHALAEQFIAAVEQAHPELAGLVGWDMVCSALLDTVGCDRGLRLLAASVELLAGTADEELASAIGAFVDQVRQHGFVPRRLHFAADRYRRWARLNPEATSQARARTLQEVEITYSLSELLPAYPEVRARLFRDTVFVAADEALAEALDGLIVRLRSGELAAEDLSAAVADLRAQLPLSPDDDFFLARLSYPHLQPEDEAAYVPARAGGVQQSEMVVTLEDADGLPYRIRHALSAKEVARLHRLFVVAKLAVQLRPEHRFLVAINERDLIIGGLFYEIVADEQTAHLERIVVAEPFRGKGVAGALLEELCNRLRTAGLRSLTTGFFRPQFFYRYGFSVERRYAGLVRPLIEDPRPEEPNGVSSPMA